MADLRIVTAKYLEEHLKKGHRLSYFTSALSCNEEELFEHIDKVFASKKAKTFKKRIKGKEPASKTKKVQKEEVDTEDTVIEETETSQKTPLEQLLEKEDQLSSEVCTEEAKHSRMISERAGLKNRLIDQRIQMQEIAKKCAELQKDFEETVYQWTALGDEMRVLTSSISEKRANLESIRAEIDSLKKISMFVYTNGEIELENHGEFDSTVDESRVSEIFGSLIQNEVSENLTIKSIKQLSKVLAIVEKLKANQLKFEISFDEETMKEVYDIVSQN